MVDTKTQYHKIKTEVDAAVLAVLESSVFIGGKTVANFGDNLAKYPAFKNIKYALKQNAIFKFKIATNSETIPKDSELYMENQKAK